MLSSPPTAPASLKVFPRPGRLAMRGVLPGADQAALVATGREALRRLRHTLLEGLPLSTGHRWLARLRGPAAPDLPSLALHAAAVAPPGWRQRSMAISLAVENAAGASASLLWRRDGTTESLRWSCRGGPQQEDGACLGTAGVAAALDRPGLAGPA